MKLEKKQEKDILIFILSGRMEGTTASSLENTVIPQLESIENGAILDMKSLEYINSAGLRYVLICTNKADVINKKLLLCNLSKLVKDVFTIAGFSSFFDLDLTLDQCIKMLKS